MATLRSDEDLIRPSEPLDDVLFIHARDVGTQGVVRHYLPRLDGSANRGLLSLVILSTSDGALRLSSMR